MEETNEEKIGKEPDVVSLDRFVEILYQDYIVAPIIQERIQLTENRRNNHQNVLEKWKDTAPEKYQKGLEALRAIQELSQDMTAIQEFEKRKKQGMNLRDNLMVYCNRKKEQNFAGLEDESLISSKRLDPVTAQLLKNKYGERLVLIDGKAAYYIEQEPRVATIVDDEGESIDIVEKGDLFYHTWSGIKDSISCYDIMKKREGKETTTTTVFTRISQSKFDDPEYLELLVNHLLEDQHLLLQSYGGYIGEIENLSLVPPENTIPIPKSPSDSKEDQTSFGIYYDPVALTVAKLLERQREKEEATKEKTGPDIGSAGDAR